MHVRIFRSVCFNGVISIISNAIFFFFQLSDSNETTKAKEKRNRFHSVSFFCLFLAFDQGLFVVRDEDDGECRMLKGKKIEQTNQSKHKRTEIISRNCEN